MLAAAGAVFLNLHPTGIVSPVLLSRIVAFLALRASQGDHWPDIFFL